MEEAELKSSGRRTERVKSIFDSDDSDEENVTGSLEKKISVEKTNSSSNFEKVEDIQESKEKKKVISNHDCNTQTISDFEPKSDFLIDDNNIENDSNFIEHEKDIDMTEISGDSKNISKKNEENKLNTDLFVSSDEEDIQLEDGLGISYNAGAGERDPKCLNEEDGSNKEEEFPELSFKSETNFKENSEVVDVEEDSHKDTHNEDEMFLTDSEIEEKNSLCSEFMEENHKFSPKGAMKSIKHESLTFDNIELNLHDERVALSNVDSEEKVCGESVGGAALVNQSISSFDSKEDKQDEEVGHTKILDNIICDSKISPKDNLLTIAKNGHLSEVSCCIESDDRDAPIECNDNADENSHVDSKSENESYDQSEFQNNKFKVEDIFTDSEKEDSSVEVLTEKAKDENTSYSSYTAKCANSVTAKGMKFSLKAVMAAFEKGWTREVVYRSTMAGPGTKADIYHRSPSGVKFRSRVEMSDYLLKNNITNLTLENFSFVRKPLEVDSKYEKIRHAKGAKSHDKKRKPETFIPKSNGQTGKVRRKMKIPILKEKVDATTKGKIPPKRKVESSSDTSTIQPLKKAKFEKPLTFISTYVMKKSSGGNPTVRKVVTSTQLMACSLPLTYPKIITPLVKKELVNKTFHCTANCSDGKGEVPNLQCVKCLCLFHSWCCFVPPSVVTMLGNATKFLCPNCYQEESQNVRKLKSIPCFSYEPLSYDPPSDEDEGLCVDMDETPKKEVSLVPTLPPYTKAMFSMFTSHSKEMAKETSRALQRESLSESIRQEQHLSRDVPYGQSSLLVPSSSQSYIPQNTIPSAVKINQASYLPNIPSQLPPSGQHPYYILLNQGNNSSPLPFILPPYASPPLSSTQTASSLHNDISSLLKNQLQQESRPTKEKEDIPKPIIIKEVNVGVRSGGHFMGDLANVYHIMKRIFSYLSVPDLLGVSRVCVLWRDLAMNPTYWRVARLRNVCVKDWDKMVQFLNVRGTQELDLRKMVIYTDLVDANTSENEKVESTEVIKENEDSTMENKEKENDFKADASKEDKIENEENEKDNIDSIMHLEKKYFESITEEETEEIENTRSDEGDLKDPKEFPEDKISQDNEKGKSPKRIEGNESPKSIQENKSSKCNETNESLPDFKISESLADVKKISESSEDVRKNKFEKYESFNSHDKCESHKEIETSKSQNDNEKSEFPNEISKSACIKEINMTESLNDIKESTSLKELEKSDSLNDIEKDESIIEFEKSESYEEIEMSESFEEIEKSESSKEIAKSESPKKSDSSEDIEKSDSLEEIPESESSKKIENSESPEEVEKSESPKQIEKSKSCNEIQQVLEEIVCPMDISLPIASEELVISTSFSPVKPSTADEYKNEQKYFVEESIMSKEEDLIYRKKLASSVLCEHDYFGKSISSSSSSESSSDSSSTSETDSDESDSETATTTHLSQSSEDKEPTTESHATLIEEMMAVMNMDIPLITQDYDSYEEVGDGIAPPPAKKRKINTAPPSLKVKIKRNQKISPKKEQRVLDTKKPLPEIPQQQELTEVVKPFSQNIPESPPKAPSPKPISTEQKKEKTVSMHESANKVSPQTTKSSVSKTPTVVSVLEKCPEKTDKNKEWHIIGASLKNLKTLKKIVVGSCDSDIVEVLLYYCNQLTGLTAQSFCSRSVLDPVKFDPSYLMHCRQLEEIKLASPKSFFLQSNFNFIKLPNLKVLMLKGLRTTSMGWPYLGNNLTHLYLSSISTFTPNNWRNISSMENLITLELDGSGHDHDIGIAVSLLTLSKLKHLSLFDWHIGPKLPNCIKRCSSLKYLHIIPAAENKEFCGLFSGRMVVMIETVKHLREVIWGIQPTNIISDEQTEKIYLRNVKGSKDSSGSDEDPKLLTIVSLDSYIRYRVPSAKYQIKKVSLASWSWNTNPDWR